MGSGWGQADIWVGSDRGLGGTRRGSGWGQGRGRLGSGRGQGRRRGQGGIRRWLGSGQGGIREGLYLYSCFICICLCVPGVYVYVQYKYFSIYCPRLSSVYLDRLSLSSLSLSDLCVRALLTRTPSRGGAGGGAGSTHQVLEALRLHPQLTAKIQATIHRTDTTDSQKVRR